MSAKQPKAIYWTICIVTTVFFYVNRTKLGTAFIETALTRDSLYHILQLQNWGQANPELHSGTP